MADIQPEEVLRSETIYQGKLIDLRQDTIRLPGGKTAVREVVVHQEVVAMLPVLQDGRLVLVRQYREAVGRFLLEIPAGGIDPGESADQAVRREMVEETGYRVGAVRHLSSFYTSPGFTTELMHLYLCGELEAGTPTEETDQIEVVLLSADEAMAKLRTGEVCDAKTVLALAMLPQTLDP